ncbi:type II secretion system protein GspG [Archangium violaceum]|uniref:Type II secretion system protein G n=1 Tax=Archangium violaceum Cb vi76 TaxID=1406225 RepID=A0A084SX30_9BACT|nr:type II secretion system protein GspG [Archangium violaceum]KFA93015.1 type II secretion system protein G [Archangium violaceum Cb vi76]
MTTPRRRIHPMVIFLPIAFVALGLSVWLGLRGKHDPGAAQVHADFARIIAALESYRADHGSIPDEGDLSFLVPKYLPAEPSDPWGHPYAYASDGQRPFLQSYGQDGLRGGNGPNQDHTNHDGHAAVGTR